MNNQVLRFGLVGTVGYIADSVMLYVALAVGLGFSLGRFCSFLFAVVVTWLLNRRYTFTGQLRLSDTLPHSICIEFWRYLSAMSLGGAVNLLTYGVVIAVMPSGKIVPALGVAMGSLMGMVVNFLGAKWWVYKRRIDTGGFAWRFFNYTNAFCLVIPQVAFWISHLRDMALPGLYMDAVNPDYVAARMLNPAIHNPVFLIPTVFMPILGNLYHGVQNFYIGIPIFAVFGFNMLALRFAQGLFGAGILLLLHFILMRVTASRLIAFSASLGLATELAFVASFRTQMYIVISGSFWMLCAVYFALKPCPVCHRSDVHDVNNNSIGSDEGVCGLSRFLIISGFCSGLAVYGYFVFIFFVPAFLAMGWAHTRSWRALGSWSLGFALGMQTYVLGYISLVIKEKGLTSALEWINAALHGLAPLSSGYNIMQRLENSWMLARLALEDTGNELMIFGSASPSRWAIWKVGFWVVALLLLLVAHFVNGAVAGARVGAAKKSFLEHRHIVWLPISFILISLLFGNRLWGHHFTPLISLMYLIFAFSVHFSMHFREIAVQKIIWLAITIIFVSGNIQQQNTFFERLVETGGVGKYSNAINRMADDALSMSNRLVYVFPEWGFMMPFAFLTANQRSYEIDVSVDNLKRLAVEGRILRLYYWKIEDTNVYKQRLVAAGFEISDSGKYLQRDQRMAFAWLEASSKNSTFGVSH